MTKTVQEVLDRLIDAWNRQDIPAILDCFTPEMRYADNAVGVDLDRVGAHAFLTNFIGSYRHGFRVTPTFVSQSSDGSNWAYEWDVEGTSDDGVSMAIKGISMIEMEGDLIRSNVDYWNLADSPKYAGADDE